MSFASLKLRPELLRAVADNGYTVPTPIQLQAIPLILTGSDVLAAAQTGTGKTAGFTLPVLQRLSAAADRRPSGRPIRCLVLTPTRELAAQVEESVRTYGKYLPQIRSTVIFGGVSIGPQISALQAGVDILVATPGRLLDHHQQGTLSFGGVEILVLDEADRMLDMGFIHDIKRVISLLPAKRQNLLFSATFADEVTQLANNLLNHPRLVEVARRNAPVETVSQSVILVESSKTAKKDMLSHLIRSQSWTQVLVFTKTKHGANKLTAQLAKDGIVCLAIHGNKSQNARTNALGEFKAGRIQALIATDIAARGLDIDLLPHVVNFDLPHVPEDYVHRIGRTGRAGAAGEALSLVSREELPLLKAIENLIKRPIDRHPHFRMGDAIPVPAYQAQPSVQTANDRGKEPSQRPPRPAALQHGTSDGVSFSPRPAVALAQAQGAASQPLSLHTARAGAGLRRERPSSAVTSAGPGELTVLASVDVPAEKRGRRRPRRDAQMDNGAAGVDAREHLARLPTTSTVSRPQQGDRGSREGAGHAPSRRARQMEDDVPVPADAAASMPSSRGRADDPRLPTRRRAPFPRAAAEEPVALQRAEPMSGPQEGPSRRRSRHRPKTAAHAAPAERQQHPGPTSFKP